MLEKNENREKSRDSMFLLAEVKAVGASEQINVRVRNLSAGGMMAEGKADLERGTALTVRLRNIGDVPGQVAWTKQGAFGISFDTPVDPKLARKQVGTNKSESSLPRYARPLGKKGRTGLS